MPEFPRAWEEHLTAVTARVGKKEQTVARRKQVERAHKVVKRSPIPLLGYVEIAKGQHSTQSALKRGTSVKSCLAARRGLKVGDIVARRGDAGASAE